MERREWSGETGVTRMELNGVNHTRLAHNELRGCKRTINAYTYVHSAKELIMIMMIFDLMI